MKKPAPLVALLLLVAAAHLFASPPAANEDPRGGYDVPSAVMSAGGSAGAGDKLLLVGTLGQPTPVGVGASDSFVLFAGFWKKFSVVTDVLETALPGLFRNALLPNAPNPFNPTTTIRYEVESASPVQVDIYDLRGRWVRGIVNEIASPGRHEAVWDGRTGTGEDAPSGIYLSRIRIGSFRDVRKMILVR